MTQGSCLCGAVRYEIDGPFKTMLSCHCSICRKHHGTLFATFVSAPLAGFRWLSGEDKITRYRSSDQFDRPFCSICGSAVATPVQHLGLVFAPAGPLEGDPGIRPQGHIFAGSKAPWYEITDGLAQYDEYPPSFTKVHAVPGPDKPAHRDGVVHGSCLCDDIEFEFTGIPSRVMNCHCSRCRHSRGAAHATNVFLSADQFRWLKGGDKAKRYKVPEAERFAVCFCPRCGGKVPSVSTAANFAMIPAGSLDDAPGMEPLAHIFVGSKAPWFDITDNLPQYQEYPPPR
jgi:hypothetical protein